MRQDHQRNSGNCRSRDQRKKDETQDGHDTAIDVLSHNVFIGCSPQDRVVRKGHYHHAKDDRDVHEGKRPHAGDGNDERQDKHSQPSDSEDGDLFCRVILAPGEIVELADVVGAGQSGLDRRASDAGQSAKHRHEQRLGAEWISRRGDQRFGWNGCHDPVSKYLEQDFQGYRKNQKRSGREIRREQKEDSTMKAAGKISEEIGRPLSRKERKKAGPWVHYAFGTSVGAVFGVATEMEPASVRGMNPVIVGTAYGTAVFLAAHEVAVPALKLSSNPLKEPIQEQIAEFVSHLLYGIGTALTYDCLRKLKR